MTRAWGRAGLKVFGLATLFVQRLRGGFRQPASPLADAEATAHRWLSGL